MTPADIDFAIAVKKLEAGQMTPQAFAKAEKAHLRAKIDWSRLPHATIAAIWDAMLDLPNTSYRLVAADGSDQDDSREVAAQNQLRRLWAVLKPDEARELFDLTVLHSWPQWMVFKSAGKEIPATWQRRQVALYGGLKRCMAEFGLDRAPAPRPIKQAGPPAEDGKIVAARPARPPRRALVAGEESFVIEDGRRHPVLIVSGPHANEADVAVYVVAYIEEDLAEFEVQAGFLEPRGV